MMSREGSRARWVGVNQLEGVDPGSGVRWYRGIPW